MKIRFDDPTIRNLKPGATVYDCMADKEPGFGLRIHPSGTLTFYYQYKIDGQRRFMSLGNYPAMSLKKAREEYQIELAKVKALRSGRADGVDPVAEKKRRQEQRVAEEAALAQSLTVSDLVDEYIKKHAMKFKRSWQEDERILHKEILNEEKKKGAEDWSKRKETGTADWGKRKAQDITKRDVVLLLEKIIERGSPGMSNNTFQVVRKMFNFAVERDILPYSPATGVKAMAPKVAKDRALSADEIKLLWSNFDNAAISDEIKRALKLILVTGQRPGEVIGMHRNELDGHWWTIPAERAKNGKSHRVYLTSTAIGLIGSLKMADKKTGQEVDRDYIFRCPHISKEQSIDPHALAIAVNRNLAFPLSDRNGKPLYQKNGNPATENILGVEKFTPHDLRRTAATFMAQQGEMDEVIDAILNHAKQGVIKVYNQYRYDREKQLALESWERKLNSIITGEASGKVVSMQGRKKVA